MKKLDLNVIYIFHFFLSDSFSLYIKNNEEFEKKMDDYMDYSNYRDDHSLYNTSRKAELGYFKDELDCDSKCVEFVGLRSKCYALKIKKNDNFYEKKVCKGLGRVAIKNRLKFNEYKECLMKKRDFRHHYTGIVSQKQNIFTVVRKKKALSCFDSKRWIFSCGIHSSPFGSILIDRYKNKCFKCSRNLMGRSF
jgi:hypothetical protein